MTTITIDIDPETGEIRTDVEGMEGPGCEGLLSFLDGLGDNVETTRKPQFFNMVKQRVSRATRRKVRS